jgi:hypothetical protein
MDREQNQEMQHRRDEITHARAQLIEYADGALSVLAMAKDLASQLEGIAPDAQSKEKAASIKQTLNGYVFRLSNASHDLKEANRSEKEQDYPRFPS